MKYLRGASATSSGTSRRAVRARCRPWRTPRLTWGSCSGARRDLPSRTAVNPRSRVEVRDVASNRVLYSRMITIGRGRGGLFFSPDGRRLAVPGCCRPGSPIEVWDAGSGERELSVAVDGYAASLAFAAHRSRWGRTRSTPSRSHRTAAFSRPTRASRRLRYGTSHRATVLSLTCRWAGPARRSRRRVRG